MADKLWQKKKTGGHRTLRVAHEIKEILSDLFRRDLPYDPEVGEFYVTVTSVKVSSSLQDALVFVIPLERDKSDAIIGYLNKHAPYFRSGLSRRLGLKFAPNFRFLMDESYDYADKMHSLLSKIEIPDQD